MYYEMYIVVLKLTSIMICVEGISSIKNSNFDTTCIMINEEYMSIYEKEKKNKFEEYLLTSYNIDFHLVVSNINKIKRK